jgi:photosystem II stability/assembly factor-like uncharacterized protein
MVGAYESPARWRYHPQVAARQLTRLQVENGTLYAGERGERWLVSDRPHAAAQLAPEALIAVSPTATGWVFIGESGTAYETEQPLGPFIRSNSPFEPLFHVTGAGSTIVGLQRDGRLSRTGDAGASWERVGPPDARFVGVALQSDRSGLAVQVPERLWTTDDGGASWNLLDVPPLGAVGVERVDSGFILVRGVFGSYRWWPGKTPALEQLDAAPPRLDLKLGAKPPRGPDAGAMAEGRAVVVGSTYVEVAPIVGKRHKHKLLRGPVTGRLRSLKLDKASGCRYVRLAGFDRWLEIACVKGSESDASTEIRFLRSEDSGKTWSNEDFEARGRVADLQLALGVDGELLVTGVCLASSSRRGCRPQGVHHRREAEPDEAAREGAKGKKDAAGNKGKKEAEKGRPRGPKMELAPSATPALRGVALAIAFSLDGRTAYMIGKRTKDGRYAMYVSDDVGRTFHGRELPQLEVDESEEYREDEWRPPEERTSYGLVSLTAAEDGTLALVVSRWNEHLVVAFDEAGRLLSAAEPPAGTQWLGAVGMRALALSGAAGIAWETLDGGASWTNVGQIPVGLCEDDEDCELPVRCHVGGCVVADELSRIGWRGQADDEGGVMLPPDDASTRYTDRRLRTPIGCVLGEDEWQLLENADQRPTAHRAAIGDAVWFTLARDLDRGAGGAHVAKPGAKQTVQYVPLLPPVANPAVFAMQVRSQIEGVAAVRYRAPSGAGAQLTDIRLAWLNLFEGPPVRTSLGRSLPYRPGDFTTGPGNVQVADPALLSIAAGGLYFRPHAQARDQQTTYFLDGRTVEQIPGIEWPTVVAGSARSEMAHVDGQHVPLLIWHSGAAVARARQTEDGWTFDAETIGLLDPTRMRMRQDWNLAYDPKRAGLWVMRTDDRREIHSAFHRISAGDRATDAPLAVPLQRHTGDTPSACSTRQRQSTPRIVAPYQGGTRHPVIVTDAREPLRVLLTSNAVLHGTPEQPCTAAFDAELVMSDSFADAQSESAILPVDDLAHSWFFRSISDGNQTRVEYRPMECKLEPGAEVPDEVYQQPGTLVSF